MFLRAHRENAICHSIDIQTFANRKKRGKVLFRHLQFQNPGYIWAS